MERPRLTIVCFQSATVLTNEDNGRIAVVEQIGATVGELRASSYANAFEYGRKNALRTKDFGHYAQAIEWAHNQTGHKLSTKDVDKWLTEYGSNGPHTHNRVDGLHNTT